jgi:hypothetical protein
MNSAVRDYLASIGKKGGAVASEAQKAAARENGKKGGRPPKKERTARLGVNLPARTVDADSERRNKK